MGWLKNYLNSRVDGKFQWYDLFHPLTSGINAITGNDRTEWVQDLYDVVNIGKNMNQGKYTLEGDDGRKVELDGPKTSLEETAKQAEIGIKEKLEDPNTTLGDLVGIEGTPFMEDAAKEMYDGAVDTIEKGAEGIDYVFGTDISESQIIEDIKENSPSNTSEPTNKETTINEVQDKTWDNVETNLTSFDDYLKHIEEREDTAYQRAVKDMRKAGINPNLMNVQPASTSSSANIGSAQIQGEQNRALEQYLEELDSYITNELKTSEGEKDRLASLITNIIMLIAFRK